MGRRPYRVEMVFPKHGSPKFFLVKDIKVKGKKRKVRKYLGIKKPTIDEIEKYRRDYAYHIEIKAALKRAELSSEFYTSEYLTKSEIINLEEIKYLYKTLMDFMTTNEIETYEKNFEVHYIQGTTAIEGNTISIQEAHDLLINEIIPKQKSLREINEVQNFKKVVAYRNRYRGKVTLDFIKTLHSLILSNIDTESAGSFRRSDNVGIEGCDLKMSPHVVIEEELENLISQYYQNVEDMHHPFEQAILFHYNFEIIHPFTDGNGRVGREILNYMLKRANFPKLLFLGEDRSTYINALKCGNDGNYQDMTKTFAWLIKKQRYDILKSNLADFVKPIERKGQLLITDFVDIR